MAFPRPFYDLLCPRKRPRRASPSPFVASKPSLPSDLLASTNPTSRPNASMLTGVSSLLGSVVAGDGAPCAAGALTSNPNSSSGCFSAGGGNREKRTDGTVIPRLGVAFVSGSLSAGDEDKGLSSGDTLLQNPSFETLVDVGSFASALASFSSVSGGQSRDPCIQNRSSGLFDGASISDSTIAVSSSISDDHSGGPRLDEASVRNRNVDSFVNSGTDGGLSLIESSGSVSEDSKAGILLDGKSIENPSSDSFVENSGGFGSKVDVPMPISDDQKKRIEIYRSFARAKRNLRICTERVSIAPAEGLGSFKLEELLVEETWLEALAGEFQKPYMKNLCRFVECEVGGSVAIYPPPLLIFNALNSTPFDKVKVVIIGQDPYHGPGQAMGLAFSVPQGVKIPSSLLNIFKELQADVGCSIQSHGNLERWAIQGVLLLNTVLTVRHYQANSHAKRGWEVFTDSVIRFISRRKRGIVFLLWGNSAQEKSRLIDATKHHILKASHPSGLSAHRGFFGCRHFSQTNRILEEAGLVPIDWQL